jgi:predicted Zn-dependent protease
MRYSDDPQLQLELKRIRRLLDEGNRQDARKALYLLRGEYPQLPALWLLLEGAEDSVEGKAAALGHYLPLRPDDQAARERWRGYRAAIDTGNTSSRQQRGRHREHVSPRFENQEPPRSSLRDPKNRLRERQTRRKQQKPLWKTIRDSSLVLPVLGILIVIGIAIVALQLRQVGERNVVVTAPTATLAVLSQPTTAPSETPLSLPTSTSPPEPTPTEAGNLESNPTLDINPVFEIASAAVPRPSLRFHSSPVRIYMNTQELQWVDALQHAIAQVTGIVPIVQVIDASQTDITVEIMSPAAYSSLGNCPETEISIGCAQLIAVRNFEADAPFPFTYQANVWLSRDAVNPRGSLLHELMHAFGVTEHSQDPNDIMYPFLTEQTTLSFRDAQRLRELYTTP